MTSAAHAFVILMMRTDVLEDVKHVKVIMSGSTPDHAAARKGDHEGFDSPPRSLVVQWYSSLLT